MDGEPVLSLRPPRGPLCAFILPSFLAVIHRFSASRRPNSETLKNVHKAEGEGFSFPPHPFVFHFLQLLSFSL